MSSNHPKYGNYYGVLVAPVRGTQYGVASYNEEKSAALIEALMDAGCTEILIDADSETDVYGSTIYFEIGPQTNVKRVFLELHKYGPDELSEESENCFRAWWD